MENVREIVLDTLLSLEREEAMSHRLIRDVLDKYDYLDAREKGFIKRVTEGTLERRLELDHYLEQYSSVPVKKMKPLIRCLMRMSVYQLVYMDTIPDSAVCNEACKLAQKRHFQNLKGFVNGVLRKIAREKSGLSLPDPKEDLLSYLCIRYSMPEMITKLWLSEYGEEVTESILKGLLEIHPVSLRMTGRVTREKEEKLAAELEEAGITLQKNRFLPGMYTAKELEGIGRLRAFQEGDITVQDASSALAVMMAGIKAGDLVVDVCAAPGGKSVLAAEYAGPSGKVIAGDVSEQKIEKILENKERMRQDNLEVRIWDGRVLQKDLSGRADVVLLDVPCSGLGVLGKKRDIKYHVTEQTFSELEVLQKEIVRNAWQYVKPGGILLYSTCTVRAAENREMVKWMTGNLPLEPVSISEMLPEEISRGVAGEREAFKKVILTGEQEDCCAQLLPGLLDTDGFFIAKLRRKQEI